jgi:hypothetical protein
MNRPLTRRFFLYSSGMVSLSWLALPQMVRAQLAPQLPLVRGVEMQPLIAQVKRLLEATEYLGMPLAAQDKAAVQAALRVTDFNVAGEAIQSVLDRYCLVGVHINAEMRVKVARGEAKAQLVEGGWRQFLVKVHNESGTTAQLRGVSPHAQSVFSYRYPPPSAEDLDRYAKMMKIDVKELEKRWKSSGANRPYGNASDTEYEDEAAAENMPITDRWLDLQMFDSQPLVPALSGLPLEYRILQLYSRDASSREATLAFNVGQGTQDLGFRNEVPVLFECLPAQSIRLRVRERGGAVVMAAFVIRDTQGRIYPSQAKRLAPDFAFHPQVYRTDGEVLKLAAGTYEVEFWRGPESILKTQSLVVKDAGGASALQEAAFEIERWIDPSKFGYWSGDHHIHAAGCAHYQQPTEGVRAEDMIRHTLGEDLKVGANLTWGPAFDYQKQFFTGYDDKVSKPPYLLHYDVEVSGFGSHKSGHLVLLRLKEEIYPGGDSDKHWPTLCLNTLRWAKKQGAVCGPAHSGFGLAVDTDELPNYLIPPYDGIGANEYIVDVTHQVPGPDGKLVPAVDFMSTVDTPYVWELNMWYHTLSVGFRTRISGETDFPCIYGERVGMGRSYVKLDGKLNYADWCEGIRRGCNYVSDGKSHLLEFKVDSVALGERGSELKLTQPRKASVKVKAAALLDMTPKNDIRHRPYAAKPFWDIERSRIGETREVPVEVIVNGYAVARKTIVADGTVRDLSFEVPIERSSWIAVRVLASSHTNPIFVIVAGKPIRASRRSAQWCLNGVDQCWSQKESLIKAEELDDAKAAYEHARETYRRLLTECETE